MDVSTNRHPIFIASLLTCLAFGAAVASAGEKSSTFWLDKLEERGKAIESFEADLVYRKLNDLTGEKQTRGGHVEYVAPVKDKKRPAMFAVRFNWTIVDDRKDNDKLEYIFDGHWLAEKQHKRRVFIKRQVVAPGEEIDPLNLDGPFPLPMGQRRKEVLARFDVRVVEDRKPDPTKVHLVFRPLPDVKKIEGQRDFDKIDLWFDREELIPTKVVTLDATSQTTVELHKPKVNSISDDQIAKRFNTTPPPGWQYEVGSR